MNHQYKLRVHSGPEDVLQELNEVLPQLKVKKAAHENEPHLEGEEFMKRYALRLLRECIWEYEKTPATDKPTTLMRGADGELFAFSAQTATPTGYRLAKIYSDAIKAGYGNNLLMPAPPAGISH